MGMKIHERFQKVRLAQSALAMATVEIVEKHGLTFAEVNGILLEVAQSFNSQAIRFERDAADGGTSDDEA